MIFDLAFLIISTWFNKLIILEKCDHIAVISFFRVLTVQMLGAPMSVDFIKTVQ